MIRVSERYRDLTPISVPHSVASPGSVREYKPLSRNRQKLSPKEMNDGIWGMLTNGRGTSSFQILFQTRLVFGATFTLANSTSLPLKLWASLYLLPGF